MSDFNGFANSNNIGLNWVSRGKINNTDTQVANLCASLSSKFLLASTIPTNKIYKSIDNGDNWAILSTLLGSVTRSSFLFNVIDNIWLCGAGNASGAFIYRSNDDGLTWSLVKSIGGGNGSFYSVVKLQSGRIIVGSAYSTIYYSDDLGLTWNLLYTFDSGTVIYSLCNNPITNSLLAFVSTSLYIYRSMDGGITWS